MKKLVFRFIVCLASIVNVNGSVPQVFSFQAAVRDGNDQLIADSPIGVHVVIIRNDNEVVYEEERVETTNRNGLLSFAVGEAKAANSIENVDWSEGTFKIRCDMDLNGGNKYTVSQTTQLTSVPFALYAQKVSPNALPAWVNNPEKPKYDYSEITGTPAIPAKLSELENDSAFVTAHQVNSMLLAMADKMNLLESNNQGLTHKIDSLQMKVDSFVKAADAPIVVDYRQVAPTYGFSTSSWNKSADVYKNMRKGDRIIFIVRHSERPSSTEPDVSLTDNGKGYARNAGARMAGGLAGANDAIYGSTDFLRCSQTCAMVAEGRGDNAWTNMEIIEKPIDVLSQVYIAGTTEWDIVANYYQTNREDTEAKCKNIVETLCKLSSGRTFAWFTSHDALTVILATWATEGKIKFQYGTNGWINFMSGIAVIVHPDGSWEVYPVKNLENGYMDW